MIGLQLIEQLTICLWPNLCDAIVVHTNPVQLQQHLSRRRSACGTPPHLPSGFMSHGRINLVASIAADGPPRQEKSRLWLTS